MIILIGPIKTLHVPNSAVTGDNQQWYLNSTTYFEVKSNILENHKNYKKSFIYKFTMETTFTAKQKTIPYNYEDRQWDCRFNVQTPETLDTIVNAIKSEDARGKFKYILIGGVEIGTKPSQDDYKVEHIHVAVIFHNRASKRSILKNWNIVEGNGYYLVPRNRDLPYKGWRDHHIKEYSKKNKDQLSIYENGTLPVDIKERAKMEAGPEEKKRKLNEILIEMKDMFENGQEEEAWKKFPKNYLTYGEKIKTMIHQKKSYVSGEEKDPHIWLYGFPGTGKTAILAFLYPNYYKKNLTNRFFDLYDPKVHSHIILEDLDHEAVERLGINFIKTICDEAGFAVDQKYKTPQLTKTTCLVTSNFSIDEIMNGMENNVGLEQNKAAIKRRFWHIRIDALLHLLGLKLLPKWDRTKLLRENNDVTGKITIH